MTLYRLAVRHLVPPLQRMAEIHGPGGPVPHIPDDVTVAQFILDIYHESKPIDAASQSNPWMIEDGTGRNVFYAEIRERVRGLANAIAARWKLVEDDVVCIYSPNHVDYPVAVWATHRLGAIVTAANPAYTSGELEYQLVTTRAKLLLVHSSNYALACTAAQAVGLPPERIVLFNEAGTPSVGGHTTINQLVALGLSMSPCYTERQLRPGEGRTKLAFLCFSSGTTGKPKAVCIPHMSPIASCVQMAHLANMQTGPRELRKWCPGDVIMAALPFFHIYGLIVIMQFMHFYGLTLVVVPKFNFVDYLRSIERYRVTFLPVVPPIVVLLCKHPAVKEYDLSSIRSVLCGAAPLSAELVMQLSEVLPRASIGQGYGTTETCTTVSFPQIEQKICTPGSAGRLIPGMIARVVREDGSLAGYNEPGELLVKSNCMPTYYLNNEEATKETFVDGWICTGDEVMINESAELFVIDRIKELIKVKGFQVAPAELEGHLLDHPDVSDVCVVGLPDDFSGELPLAFIAPSVDASDRMKRDPTEASRIRAALMKHVADAKVAYKQLAGGVEFVDVIPKNPSGKLLRRVLRERAKEMKTQGMLTRLSVKARL